MLQAIKLKRKTDKECSPEELAERIQRRKAFAKSNREWNKSLSPEQRDEIKRNNKYDKIRREEAKIAKEEAKQHKIKVNRELAVLKFMIKNDVLHHHHGTKDSQIKELREALEYLRSHNTHHKYDPYIWNRQGEGHNYLPLCQLGNIFSSSEFKSIYDVPLDGTYMFHSFDSGERGLGSFHYITARKIEAEIFVPKVNPGGFPPVIYR